MTNSRTELESTLEELDDNVLDELRESDPELHALLMEEADDLIEGRKQKDEQPRNAIKVRMEKGETETRALARFSCNPEALAAISISELAKAQTIPADINDLISELETQTLAMRDDNTRQQAILASHSHTLDALFNHLLRLALAHFQSNRISTGNEILRLAMRSQSQCRTTLDSLAVIQRPAIKQTNIAHGHQQVNNYPQSKLLEEPNGERLDTGTPAKAVAGDQALETVDKKHGAKND